MNASLPPRVMLPEPSYVYVRPELQVVIATAPRIETTDAHAAVAGEQPRPAGVDANGVRAGRCVARLDEFAAVRSGQLRRGRAPVDGSLGVLQRYDVRVSRDGTLRVRRSGCECRNDAHRTEQQLAGSSEFVHGRHFGAARSCLMCWYWTARPDAAPEPRPR